MKKLSLIACTVFAAAHSFAAPIVGSGSFTGFGANPNNNNMPFWDRSSFDGTNCNVGFFLAGGFNSCSAVKNGTPAAGLELGAANLEYFSDSNLLTPFQLSAGTYTFTFEGRISGSDNFQVGYNVGAGDIDMFTNASTVGDTFVLSAASAFSLYIRDGDNFFRSTDALVGAAAFRNLANGKHYLSFEDRRNGDFDYNDVILSTTFQPVPEPSTYALVGLAMAGVAAARRFRS